MDNIFFAHMLVIFFCFIINIFIYFCRTIFLKKEYFNSIKLSSAISFFLLFFLLFLVPFSFLYFVTYLIFINLLYIFAVVIYTPNSSIRFKILNILYDSKFAVSKKNLLKKYNDRIIFERRLKRLLESKTINFDSGYFFIKNKKTFFIHIINTFFKKLIY
jgi:hypothetical protein